ncbi:MAG: CPBP family intramembrane metalloprotease [Lachnospiraceae bacterium]|nr:CPBP family intramembrane metalloprotease [Lachnospiraceae bacterium]
MNEVKRTNMFTLISFVFMQIGAIFVLMFVLLFIGIVGNMMNKINDIQDFLTTQLNDTTTLMIMSQAAILIPALVYLFKYNGWKSVPFKVLGPVKIILLILLTFCVYPLLNFISLFSMMFVEDKIGDTAGEIVDAQPFIVGVLVIAVMPAIGEELFCRGVLYGSYRKVSKGKAVLLSAIMFGFMHGNFNQFIYTALMGMIFALVVEITDSVLASMIMHFLFNGTTVVYMYLPQLVEKYKLDIDISQFETTEDLEVNIEYIVSYLKSDGLILIGAAVGTVVILYVFALINGKNLLKMFSKEDEDIVTVESEIHGKKRLVTLPLVFAMLFQFMMMIIAEFFLN